MKKQISILAFSVLFAFGIATAAPQAPDQAQGSEQAGPHQPNPDRQLKMLSKHLNLTADQQNQILPILTDRQQQVQNVRSDNSLSSKDRHVKMREIRDSSDTKIKAVLTDDQKQAFDQMQQQMRERAKQHRDAK
jgi:periplasmic protein CpxP/Spy